MKARIEYTNSKGKRVVLSDHNQPREFPNRRAATNYIRNHRMHQTTVKPVVINAE